MNPWDRDSQRIGAELNAEAPALVYRKLSEIQARPIDWLWKGWIARGKVTMIAGNPGLGKSQETLGIAAAVSTGGKLPDGTACKRGRVIIVSAEDDPADTVRPRLEAAGANLEEIFILDAVAEGCLPDGTTSQRGFSLAEDLTKLRNMIEEVGEVSLIILDPISAYLGKVDSHNNAEVRSLIAPLSKLAEQCDAAFVCVSHLNKSSGNEALTRVTGSLAFVAAARAAYLVVKDPTDDNRRFLLPLKNNLDTDQTGLAFRVQSAQVPSNTGRIETSQVIWDAGVVTMTADQALRAAAGEAKGSTALTEAIEWLTGFLEAGPKPTNEVRAEAEEAGFTWSTLRRAKSALGIKPAKEGLAGGWSWHLAEDAREGAQG